MHTHCPQKIYLVINSLSNKLLLNAWAYTKFRIYKGEKNIPLFHKVAMQICWAITNQRDRV